MNEARNERILKALVLCQQADDELREDSSHLWRSDEGAARAITAYLNDAYFHARVRRTLNLVIEALDSPEGFDPLGEVGLEARTLNLGTKAGQRG